MSERTKTLAILCPGENFSSRWVKSLMLTVFDIISEYDLALVPPIFDFCTNPYASRNILAQELDRFGEYPDYVLWIDDDNPVTPETFAKLWVHLGAKEDAAAVAGWAWCESDQYESGAILSCGRFRKDWTTMPFDAAFMRDHFYQSSTLVQVDYTGFPAILMHGSTLKAAGQWPFSPYVSPIFDNGISGEDYAFCRKLKEKGLNIYVAPDCQIPHLKLRAITPSVLLEIPKEAHKQECAAMGAGRKLNE